MVREAKNKAQALERKILEATVEYREGPWGEATKTIEGAARLSQPAALVFIALLERNGVDGARLAKLSSPRTNSVFGPDDVHFLVLVGEECFDLAARRFEPDGPEVSRRMFVFVRMLWGTVEEVELDAGDPSSVRAEGDGNWRALVDAVPPGDGIGWEHPGGGPIESVG